MKKSALTFVLLLAFIACKETKEEKNPSDAQAEIPEDIEKPRYPDELTKVFDAHGGLELWEQMRTLEFSIEKPDGLEITTTDLKERYALVEMPDHTIGFDGGSVWMKSKQGKVYDGSPEHYYNLMFYFFTMPFVLTDNGTNYSDVQALTIEGKTYPGIQVTYDSGFDESPNDKYVLYYDADTHQMTWLGYTATFGNHENSNDWNFINYGQWQEVEGLLLPKIITWHNVQGMKPTTVRDSVTFSHISLSQDKMDLRMYMMPDGAEEIQ